MTFWEVPSLAVRHLGHSSIERFRCFCHIGIAMHQGDIALGRGFEHAMIQEFAMKDALFLGIACQRIPVIVYRLGREHHMVQRAMSFLTKGVRRVRWYASAVLRTASA